MRIFLISLGLMPAMLCFACNVDTIPARDTLIEYTGRIDFSNPDYTSVTSQNIDPLDR